jgi:hypothetical protein
MHPPSDGPRLCERELHAYELGLKHAGNVNMTGVRGGFLKFIRLKSGKQLAREIAPPS